MGARPQIIKFAALYPELKKTEFDFILVHSGQHYDNRLSYIFFRELNIPQPDYNLEVGSGTHAYQTKEIMLRLKNVVEKEKTDFGILFGDTNTTLAGSLLFSRLHIPFAHIEAGLRSFNNNMPEEINRKITDKLSYILFAPSELAVKNLEKEGIKDHVYNVGDLHFDLFLRTQQYIDEQHLDKPKDDYIFLTVHREENTENPDFIRELLIRLDREKINCIFPCHPRTYKLIEDLKLNYVKVIKPLPYTKTLFYIKHSKMVLTDSGGIQKESYFMKKRVIILRRETEWQEIVKSGFGKLMANDINSIIELIKNPWEVGVYRRFYGDGNAKRKIVDILKGL